MANGIFGREGGLFSPERAQGLAALGLGLSQLGAGQQVNLSQPLAALQKRQQDAKQREQLEGLSSRFTPDQQAILASMPPNLAMQVIAQDAFGPTPQIRTTTIGDRLVNKGTGAVIADFSTPPALTALQQQAIDGGLTQGTPEFRDFMLRGGSQEQVPVHQITGKQLNAINGVTPGTEGAALPGQIFNVENGKATPAGGSGVNVTQTVTNPGPTSPAGKKFDEEIGIELAQFRLTGAASASKNLAQLKAVHEGLLTRSSGNVTGPVTGPLSSLPFIGPTLFSNAIDAQEEVAGVVQQSLKEILGGAFSQKEGEALIARAFNPNLDEAVNLKRVGRLIRQLELAFEQKSKAAIYFAANGTLAGWTGKIPSINDFDILGEDTPVPKQNLNFNLDTGEFE